MNNTVVSKLKKQNAKHLFTNCEWKQALSQQQIQVCCVNMGSLTAN